jgi:omega-6 fatty acid desaturase (delta-12 desaturase)
MPNESQLFMKYKSSYGRASLHLVTHMLFGALIVYVMTHNIGVVPIVVLLALFNVKTIVIFHDCGHNSFTPSNTVNYVIGSLYGILVMLPFCFNYDHHNHHLTSGNVNNEIKHKFNETVDRSLTEYAKWSAWKRSCYKAVRSPVIFFSVLPSVYVFLVSRCETLHLRLANKRIYKQSLCLIMLDTFVSNIGIFFLMWGLRRCEMALLYCCSLVITSSFLFTLIHNHHVFNPPYITNNDTYNQRDSGLLGSAHLQYPLWFTYFTMGIEYHHIHHVNSKIPGYNLQLYHEDVVSSSCMFDNVNTISMSNYYNNLWLVLYDDVRNTFITFAQADDELKKMS